MFVGKLCNFTRATLNTTLLYANYFGASKILCSHNWYKTLFADFRGREPWIMLAKRIANFLLGWVTGTIVRIEFAQNKTRILYRVNDFFLPRIAEQDCWIKIEKWRHLVSSTRLSFRITCSTKSTDWDGRAYTIVFHIMRSVASCSIVWTPSNEH